MKGLVLYPWLAALVALGYKTCETRWSPPAGSMRPEGVRNRVGGHCLDRLEPVAIVAGRKQAPLGRTDLGSGFEMERERGSRDVLLRGPIAWPYRVPSGHVMAVAKPFGAWPVERVGFQRDLESWQVVGEYLLIPEVERPFGDYSPGRWVIPLSDVRRVDPRLCPGGQGVISLPADVSDYVEGSACRVTALTVWEHLRTGNQLDGVTDRVPEWAEQWVWEVATDLMTGFYREYAAVEATAAAGVPGPGPYQKPAQYLLAGEVEKAQQSVWAMLRPHAELPARVAA